MKNSLADLSNHLFTMVEALADDDVTADKERLAAEVARAKAAEKEREEQK